MVGPASLEDLAMLLHLPSLHQLVPSESRHKIDSFKESESVRGAGGSCAWLASTMPPLPANGSSYPPSSSGYQPLNPRDDDDADLESLPTSSPSVRRRTFTHSPYRSRANAPTDLLQTFLSDTRPASPVAKALHLRIAVRGPGGVRTVELPLPELTIEDSLPFALADDVPCLRGLPTSGGRTWGQGVRGFVNELTGSSPGRHEGGSGLQVWNSSQNKPLYASQEEIDRYRVRLATGVVPPWTPLNSDFLPSEPIPTASQITDEDVDKLFTASDSLADFDLSSVFTRTRQRKTSRLVSSGLQEAIERFADDRHFSKRLHAREAVWGWDLVKLKKALQVMLQEAGEGKGKGKARQQEVEEIEVEVVGVDSGPMYHVVWAPIPLLTERCGWLFQSRGSLVSIVIITTLLLSAILVGVLSNTLLIMLALLALLTWASLMRLIRTQHNCVYDTVGTAWCLGSRWVRLQAPAEWDHDAVVESLGSDPHVKLAQRAGDGWFMQRGTDQDEWLDSQRERLMHWIRS